MGGEEGGSRKAHLKDKDNTTLRNFTERNVFFNIFIYCKWHTAHRVVTESDEVWLQELKEHFISIKNRVRTTVIFLWIMLVKGVSDPEI